MKARGSGTPGRAAASRVNRVLHPAADRGNKKTKKEEEQEKRKEEVTMMKMVDEKTKAKKNKEGAVIKFSELVRAAWHAFPGCLALWLYSTFFADRLFRTWRAHPVAMALLPLTAACWCVEWLRLTPSRCRTLENKNKNESKSKRHQRNGEKLSSSLLECALSAVDSILREGELRRIHGTAWYLLGVCISLSVYPADVAVLSICHLAW